MSYARATPEQALAAAAAADAEIAAGKYRGPLRLVPLGIKDLFWKRGVPTAAGTMLHRDFVPQGSVVPSAVTTDSDESVLGEKW